MADLFQGSAPPNVETFRDTTAKAPEYLTNYLQDVAKAGQTALQRPEDQLVAPLSSLQTGAISAAPAALSRYQSPMDAALASGKAGTSVDMSDISKFYNPYESAVVEDMATRSAQNVQRNLLPQLTAGFVGTGGLGGTRYANALGQTMGDVNTSLLQEQNKAKMAGYQSALDAALKEAGIQTSAASALGTLGSQEQQAATTGLKTEADLGAIEQAQKQAQINAPLTQATNVAALMRGYTYPTTTSEVYKGPASSYGPSILSQIGGLGSLLASGTNTTGSGWLDKAGSFLTNAFGTAPGAPTQTGTELANSYFSPNTVNSLNITSGNPEVNYEGSVQGGGIGSV
jgi:hypothetical protein